MPRGVLVLRARPRTGPRRVLAWVAVVALVVSAVVVVRFAARPSTAQLVGQAPPGTALAALGRLRVAGRAPQTGYARERFGSAWSDVDGNGCDTRDDILARDLSAVRTSRTDPCEVVRGMLDDPYRPGVIDFERGPDSAAVQIDHVVALSDAWQTGAQQIGVSDRLALANDPLNLLAVDGEANQDKGDSDAASWLPPNRAYRCTYVARQVAVKAKYGLWVTPAERDAIARVLSRCPGQPLPDGDDGVGPAVGSARLTRDAR